MAQLHDGFKGNPAGLDAFARIARELQPGGRLTVEDFLHSESSWDMIADRYRKYCTDPSFKIGLLLDGAHHGWVGDEAFAHGWIC